MSCSALRTPIFRSLKPVSRLSPASASIVLFAMTFLALTAFRVYRLGSYGPGSLIGVSKNRDLRLARRQRRIIGQRLARCTFGTLAFV